MKVSIIGAGNVGASAALFIAQKNICNHIVLIDIVESVIGKAKDIQQASSTLGFDTEIIGSKDYKEIKDSDIIVNTAGFPRKAGSGSRDELLEKNIEIVKTVSNNIKKYAPNALFINVTNPVDAITYAFSRLLKNKVFGMGGLLDASRAESFISKETGIPVKDIKIIILGTHGDTMVLSKKFSAIKGKPITNFLSEKKIEEIIEKTKSSGGELTKLIGTSAWVAPGSCIARQIEAIIKDTKDQICLPAYLNGEYGYYGIYLGVPVILGRNGVEKIIELDLPEDEKNALEKAAKHVKEVILKIEKLIK